MSPRSGSKEAWYALLNDNGADGLTLERMEDAVERNAYLAPLFDCLRSTDLRGEFAAMQRQDLRQRELERRRGAERMLAKWRQFSRPARSKRSGETAAPLPR